DRAVALAPQPVGDAVDLDHQLDALGAIGGIEEAMAHEPHAAVAGQEVGPLEHRPEFPAADLGLAGVGVRLHDRAELDLHAPWHDDAMVALEQEGDAALARLAVDPDD